jgi:hypothetical protein
MGGTHYGLVMSVNLFSSSASFDSRTTRQIRKKLGTDVAPRGTNSKYTVEYLKICSNGMADERNL